MAQKEPRLGRVVYEYRRTTHNPKWSLRCRPQGLAPDRGLGRKTANAKTKKRLSEMSLHLYLRSRKSCRSFIKINFRPRPMNGRILIKFDHDYKFCMCGGHTAVKMRHSSVLDKFIHGSRSLAPPPPLEKKTPLGPGVNSPRVYPSPPGNFHLNFAWIRTPDSLNHQI